jgi:hypothetical protein
MFCCTMFAATSGREHSPDCEHISPLPCPNHRVKAHDKDGLKRWCDFCGKDATGVQVRPGAGGWGVPSRIKR